MQYNCEQPCINWIRSIDKYNWMGLDTALGHRNHFADRLCNLCHMKEKRRLPKGHQYQDQNGVVDFASLEAC